MAPSLQGLLAVGDDLVEIDADDAPEALAGLAGAERRVVREERGLGRAQRRAALAAGEALVELERRAAFDMHFGAPAAERERRVERVGEARAIVGGDLQAIDQQRLRALVRRVRRLAARRPRRRRTGGDSRCARARPRRSTSAPRRARAVRPPRRARDRPPPAPCRAPPARRSSGSASRRRARTRAAGSR